jgi:hypothetical protein
MQLLFCIGKLCGCLLQLFGIAGYLSLQVTQLVGAEV